MTARKAGEIIKEFPTVSSPLGKKNRLGEEAVSKFLALPIIYVPFILAPLLPLYGDSGPFFFLSLFLVVAS